MKASAPSPSAAVTSFTDSSLSGGGIGVARAGDRPRPRHLAQPGAGGRADAAGVAGLVRDQREREVAVPVRVEEEPVGVLEADPAARGHHLEELAGELRELFWSAQCVAQHPREHVARQQADVVGEHAEDEPVDEVGYRLRVVAALSQRLRDRRERRGGALRQRPSRFPWPQPLGVRECPLKPVARRCVGEILERDLVRPADAVRPVRAGPEPHHVGDDQQRRVLQRQRVLPQLVERGVEVRPSPLVFPREVVPLPDVSPAVAAGVLPRPRSKQYVAPDGSASAGVGSSSRRHRSRKCS